MPPPIEPKAFRQVLGCFATGVTVMTTRVEGEAHGMTANAFSSVSLDPPLVLVCVAHTARSHGFVRETGRFTLSILGREQRSLSERFAKTGLDESFEGVACRKVATAGPVLEGALAYLDCRLTAAYEGGDHTIFVGEVVSADSLSEEGDPLLFYRGRYRSIADGEV